MEIDRELFYKKIVGVLFFTLIVIVYTGCSKPYQAKKIISEEKFSNLGNSSKDGEVFQLGIVASGGGSKAAPFVMGVLKRFVDNGWMKNVDVISSVSGGGYSAYYFYNKAIHFYENPTLYPDKNLTYFFENCELDKLNNEEIKTWEEFNRTKNSLCQDGGYQNYVRDYQDLLSYFKTVPNGGGSYWDEIKKIAILTEGFIESLLVSPFHHFSNSLFDWRVEISPLQHKYIRGINKAYGRILEGKTTNHTFEKLKTLTDNNKVPLWIINTTNFKTSWWRDAFEKDDENLSKSIFEITPYGFGSARYGYIKDTPDKIGLNLSRATLASGAFLDALGDKGYQGYLFGVLHSLNLRWGIQVPNYSHSITRQKLHNLYPFPFYYFDNASKITLADGGQSGDNLGLYALVKRKVKNIIILSASNDTKFFDKKHEVLMEDMCSVSKFLYKQDLRIKFEGNPMTDKNNTLVDFNKTFCGDGENKIKLSYYHWKKPVWKGYIVDKNDDNISNLYFIKAALDKKDLMQNARSFHENFKCQEKNHKEDNNCKYNECNLTEKYICTESNQYVRTNTRYPNSLLDFWISGTWGKDVSNFPQTSTIFNTLTSSKGLYQAYMDLGFYLSGYLEKTDLKEVLESD